MKQVILSFDYEIYFDGRNNYEMLISNTDRLLDIAQRNNCKLVFFIDAGYLFRLKSSGQYEAFERLGEQIKLIGSNGHELQFHFHPHWINAEFEPAVNHWYFDRSEYSFSDIAGKYGVEYVRNWFIRFYNLFIELSGSKSIAFRAGGLSINHFQSEYIQLLLDLEFKYDSSVMPGIKMNGKHIQIDHSSAENEDHWLIGPERGFFKRSDSNEPTLIEVPVMTVKKDRIGIYSRVNASIKYRIFNFFSSRNSIKSGGTFDLGVFDASFPTSITFDGSYLQDIIIMKHFTSAYFRQEKKILCMLSHPKSFVNESFIIFDRYLKWLKTQASVSVIGFNNLN